MKEFDLIMSGTHTGDLTELSSVNLTDAEREALLTVMQRAKVGVGWSECLSTISVNCSGYCAV